MIPNSDAKKLLQPSVVKKKVNFALKGRSSRKRQSKIVFFQEMTRLKKILKKRRAQIDAGTVSAAEMRNLEALYRRGPAAYGSVSNLAKASRLSRQKVEKFLQTKNYHTKYRQYRRRFPRLKNIAYDINEIWSIDVAYVDELANTTVA